MIYVENHAHISGFYGANKRGFARYVKSVCWRGKCSSFATTETYGRALYFLRTLMPLWRIERRGEYVIGTKRSVYKSTRLWRYERYSNEYTGRWAWMDLWAYRRRVVHRAARRPVLPVAFHLPKIEYGDALQKTAAVNGASALGKSLNLALERQPDLVVINSGDLNACHHEDDIREHFETAFGMESGWSEKRPRGGTHGTRLIDATYSNAPLGPSWISRVKRGRRLDHIAIVTPVHIAAKEAA